MTKEEFLQILQKRLSFLNYNDVKVHLDFYEEMINDRLDDGMNEFEAVEDLGTIQDIVNRIKEECANNDEITNDVTNQIKEENKTNQTKPDQPVNTKQKNDNITIFIVIAVFSFPIWFSIVIAVASLLFALGIVSITFIITGICMLFSTFFMLSNPIATILLNIGLSFLLVSLGLLVIPVFKYSFIFIKECCSKSKKYIKENV